MSDINAILRELFTDVMQNYSICNKWNYWLNKHDSKYSTYICPHCYNPFKALRTQHGYCPECKSKN